MVMWSRREGGILGILNLGAKATHAEILSRSLSDIR